MTCDATEILLAYHNYNSVKVSVGDTVSTNGILGQVSNTGNARNTSESHLLHAEQSGDSLAILNGEALPFTIYSRFLRRGDIF